jgi:Uncharacterised nucleotidyltransferase
VSSSPRAALGELRELVVSGRPPAPREAGQAWELVECAREQGLAGLLHEAVKDSADWPDAVRAELRASRRAALARGVRQLFVAKRCLALFGRAGVRALPLKGVAVGERLYASVADRPMGDVDLLVLDSWERALSALLGAGFVLQDRADHAVSLLDRESRVLVELHHSPTSCPGLHPLDADGLWSRSLGTGPLRAPSREDLLVLLALHAAFQHGLAVSLVQLLDLRRLLEREPPDAATLAAVAVGMRAERSLRAALAAARSVVGAAPDPALLETLGPDPALDGWLAARLRDPLERISAGGGARDLLSARLELARGRRFELALRTIAPRSPGSRGRALDWLRVPARATALLGRWVPALLGRR